MRFRLHCQFLLAVLIACVFSPALRARGDESPVLLRELKLFLIESLEVSPDGGKVAVAGTAFEERRVGRVAVVDLNTWETTFDKSYAKVAWCVEWSPDGRTIAVGTDDSDVRLWDVAAGKESHILKGHQSEVCSLAFSPDGKHLATGSDDATVRLWDPATGKLTRTLEEPEFPVTCVAFSPDSKQMFAGSLQFTRPISELWAWTMTSNMSPGEVLWRSEDLRISWIELSPKGGYAAIGCMRNIALLQWPDGKLHGEIASASMSACDSTFSHESSLLAIADDEQISLYAIPACRELSRFDAHDNLIKGLAFLPRSTLFVSGGWDHKLKLWRLPEQISDNQRDK